MVFGQQLDGIAEFVAVVEEGGFTAAARRMGISKSVVSERVARLEGRMNTRLINRSTRKMRLTEAGAVFFEHSVRLLAEASAAERAVYQLGDAPRGNLTVSCTADFAADHIAPALPAFVEKYPEVVPNLIVVDSYADLLSEQIDVAIRYGPLADPNMVVRRLAKQRGVVAAAPAYLERRGMPAGPEALAEHDCLLFTPFPWGAEWRFIDAAGERRRVKVGVRVKMDSGLVMRAAAEAGLGIGLFATALVGESLGRGRLVRLLPGWEVDTSDDPERAIFAVYPDNVRIPPKVRAFIDHLAASIGDPPYWDEAATAAE